MRSQHFPLLQALMQQLVTPTPLGEDAALQCSMHGCPRGIYLLDSNRG